MSDLPIEKIRAAFDGCTGPVVITAPTGSGKSTQVPRWAMARGPVIVVEPRRVACRALAARVAQLEGTKLGQYVGFQVRGETQLSETTQIRFVTPGIALRQMDRLRAAKTVILDELHERRLDVDLLLALLMKEAPQLVVMSATLDGPRVAEHLGATLLEAEGRLFPVSIKYRHGEESLPSPRGLDQRIADIIEDPTFTGDTLVFLPGKAEISAAAMALRGLPISVVELHGGMNLRRQAEVFEPTPKRKVVLATNVAETSLTVPGIELVIDAGLVRRTSYHHGRAHLALRPIAQDAADQRSGRAGRTGPGHCVRLWARRVALDAQTPPEIHRESLVPLLLGAAVCGHADIMSLSLLDAPKPHAVSDARAELSALGALDDEGQLTASGRELFGLPIDPSLGRLLVEARVMGVDVLQDVIDLVAVIASGRRLFFGPPTEDDPFRFDGCDASAFVRALRADSGPVDVTARRTARTAADRLRRALDVDRPEVHRKVDPAVLREVALRADPRLAHIARRRGKGGDRIAFANGGTELALAKESAAWAGVSPDPRKPGTKQKPAEAIVVFDVRAFGTGKDRRLLATCASPVSLRALLSLGLGQARVVRTWLAGKKRKRVMAEVEQVFAGKVLGSREEIPQGQVARDALFELLARGSLFKQAVRQTRRRLDTRALAAQLSELSVGRQHGLPEGLKTPPPFEEWMRGRIETLGVESGDELEMLSPDDVLCDDLPYAIKGIIDDLYPSEVALGDVTYQVEFDLEDRRAILKRVKGGRKTAPPRSFLPRFPGLKVFAEAGRGLHRVV